MPHFDEQGRDTWLCQGCAKVFTVDQMPTWVDGYGNVCQECMTRRPFMVRRRCCTSGNCDTCISESGHKFGSSVHTVQYLTWLRETAERIARNWAEYGAEVLEATDENIATCSAKTQQWVRESLKNPGRIK